MNVAIDAEFEEVPTLHTRRATESELAFIRSESDQMVFDGSRFVRASSIDGYSPSGDDGFGGLPLAPSVNRYVGRNLSGAAFFEEGYKRNSLINGLVNMRLACMQMPTLEFFEEKKPDVIIDDAPLIELLNHPNPLFDWGKLIAQLEGFGCIGGPAYLHCVRNNYGQVVRLFPYNSAQITPISSGGNWLDHWIYDNGAGFRLEILPDDIIQFGWGMQDWYRPGWYISPMSALAGEIDVDNLRSGMERALLKNGAIPAMLVELGPKFNIQGNQLNYTPTQLRQLSEQYKLRFGGANKGSAMVGPPGTKVHILGFDPKRMQATEFARMPETRACLDLGMPLAMLPLFSNHGNTYANYDRAQLSLYQDTMMPRGTTYTLTLSEHFRDELFKGDKRVLGVRFNWKNVQAIQNFTHGLADNNFKNNIATLGQTQEAKGMEPDPKYKDKYLWELIAMQKALGAPTPSGAIPAQAAPVSDEAIAENQAENQENLERSLAPSIKSGRIKQV